MTLFSAAVRKMTRAPGRAVRVISSPELVQLLVRHPVLRVEQDITVARGGRFLGEKLGEACVMDVDAIDIGADHLVVLPLQISRQRAFVMRRRTRRAKACQAK